MVALATVIAGLASETALGVNVEFDACPACADAAAAGIVAAVVYLLATAAPDALANEVDPDAGSLHAAEAARIRLADQDGREIVDDELSISQTINVVDEPETGPEAAAARPATTGHVPQLEDFQTVVDRLQLHPLPHGGGLGGRIEGRLFARDRLVGRFQVEIGLGVDRTPEGIRFRPRPPEGR